jgi:hypothetical protein
VDIEKALAKARKRYGHGTKQPKLEGLIGKTYDLTSNVR